MKNATHVIPDVSGVVLSMSYYFLSEVIEHSILTATYFLHRIKSEANAQYSTSDLNLV